ncbi:MAG: Crp/Fnr family transcriptional regulator [Burkholderiaceae bacterium]
MKTLNHNPCDPRHNHLLSAFPNGEWLRWQSLLESVELRVGQVLFEPGKAPAHVYFPTSAVVSLVYMTQDGETAEIAVVGNEGVVGVSLFMGGDVMPHEATVQSAGLAYRLNANAVKSAMEFSNPIMKLMLNYTHAMFSQVSQTAVCNRYHSIDQQLSRRLLQGLDRASSNELLITQEAMASLLGVRREGVTAAALKLQHEGAIQYSRGHIVVHDRQRLERHACECYAFSKKAYFKLLPLPLAA